ncbi:hypothetical protein ACEPAG_191 [Sanghuangporus baumii]
MMMPLQSIPTEEESRLETLPPEVILHILSYLDLPELDALSRLSPVLKDLAQDPILHRRRILIVAPSRVQHALFAYGGALRPTVPDLVVRNVLRGLGIERRYRMGLYFNSRESVKQYEISRRLQLTHVRHVLAAHLQRKSRQALTRMIPDAEVCSPCLLPAVRSLKWCIRKDALARMVRERENSGGSKPTTWFEGRGHGLWKENERIRLAICPGVGKIVRFFEGIGKNEGDMADATDPAVAAALAEAQHFIFVTQIYFCCMYAVFAWDWLVSLPREYKFIWKSGWTAAKMSYLFCRYWVLFVMPYILFIYVTNHSWEDCQKLYRSPVALAMWNQAGAEVVLLIRTYAFFNRNKYLLVALCASLAGVLAYQLFVDINEMLPLEFVTPPFDKGPCLPKSKPHSAHLLGFFLASLAFDATVTTMTLWKAFRLRRTCGAAASPLIQTFLREGIFYFVFISIANLINGIFYLQPKAVMSAINIPLSIMFSDLLACRMILDLRQRGYEISQPTVFTQTLPLHTQTTDGTEVTSTVRSDPSPSSLHKGPFSATQNSLPYLPAPDNQRGWGVKGLVGNGRSATGTAFTTTIDSAVFSQTQTSTGGEVRSQDGSSCLELRSFTPHYDAESEPEEKPEGRRDGERAAGV